MAEESTQTNTTTGAHIAGKSLSYYWRTVRWFALGLVLLEIVHRLLIDFQFGRWIIAIMIAIALTWWIAQRGRASLIAAVTAGGLMGIVAGGALAVFDIIWYHQWWYVLNIIRMPFLLGIIGVATGFTFYVLFRSIIQRRKQPALKGGGIYGRTKE